MNFQRRGPKTRRSASFLVVVAAVLLCTSSKSSGGTCKEKLVGNSYDCTYAFYYGQSGPTIGFLTGGCVKFVNGGLSENFSWVGVSGSLSSEFGCACQTTNDVPFSPSLNLSANAFECVGDSAGDIVQFHGKVDSGVLYGQGSEEHGEYVVFDCEKLPAGCE
jgi:hypothetical protein